jgi:hypothetical protein
MRLVIPVDNTIGSQRVEATSSGVVVYRGLRIRITGRWEMIEIRVHNPPLRNFGYFI